MVLLEWFWGNGAPGHNARVVTIHPDEQVDGGQMSLHLRIGSYLDLLDGAGTSNASTKHQGTFLEK